MSGDAVLVLALLGLSLVLFITERLALEVVALGVVLALMLGGVLSPPEALAGFSDPVVVTLAALFVVGGGVQHTGLGALLGERLERLAGPSEPRLVAATMLAGAALSAFMSSTGTVAILLPAVVGVARRVGVSPSRLLLPLACGSLLGGMLTLVGTAPNLVASNQLVARGEPPFAFLAFTPVGAAVLVVGVAYMVLVGRHLLPAGAQAAATSAAHGEADDASRHLGGRLARLRVPAASPLGGKTVAAAAPRSRTGVTVLAVEAPGGGAAALAGPTTTLAAGDVLVVHGDPTAVARLVADLGLTPAPPSPEAVDPAAQGEDLGTVEALLAPRSSLLGRTLAEVRFRERFGVTALAILRQGAPIDADLARAPLAFGDALLLHGAWSRLALLGDGQRDLVVLGPLAPRRRPARRLWTAAAVVAGMLALMATGAVPTVAAALLAAVAMVLGRCVTLEDAYRSVSWGSLVLIAGMLPMATALERVGLVQRAVDGFVGAVGPLGPTAALAGLFLLTSVLSQVMSNTATAVLVAPVAYDVAQGLGASPRAFLLAVAIAASTAFATPVASPVNALVLGPGGYRFRDFLRAGVPLQALALVVTLAVLRLLPP